MVQYHYSPLKLDLDPIFLIRELILQGTISKHRRNSINSWHKRFWPNRSSTTPSHTCQHHVEITQSHTFAALIRLSTTTHYLLTFNICEISSNNSALLPDKHLWTFLLHSSYSSSRMQSHTVGDHLSLVFTPEKNLLAGVRVHRQFCSHLIHLTPKSLFPRPKTQWSPQKSEQYRTFLSQPRSG